MHQSTRLNFVIKAHFTSNYGANEEGNEGRSTFLSSVDVQFTIDCIHLLTDY